MHAQYIQVMLSCVSNISEGAAPRQWRSPRRGARRVGATNPSNCPQRGHGHPLVLNAGLLVFYKILALINSVHVAVMKRLPSIWSMIGCSIKSQEIKKNTLWVRLVGFFSQMGG